MSTWQNPEDIKRFGENVRDLRIELNLTQADVCAKAKIEQSSLSAIENGTRNLSLNIILNLANAMNVHPERLFDFLYSESYIIRHEELVKEELHKNTMLLQSAGGGLQKNAMRIQSIGEGLQKNTKRVQLMRGALQKNTMCPQSTGEALQENATYV